MASHQPIDRTRRSLFSRAAALPRPSVADPGPRRGMAIDVALCTGCQACTVTCGQENGTDPATPRLLVTIQETDAPRIALLPRLCQHCADAPCIAACPVGASRRRRDGIVYVDADACTGCGDCVRACPYDARTLDSRTGIADSCDFCAHRVDAGLLPACVEVCGPGALQFGDLNDPAGAASRRLAAGPAELLRPDAGTRPLVFYFGLATPV